MANNRWISVSLGALAIGGLIAAYPLTSSAVGTSPVAKNLPVVTVAQPAATTTPDIGATAPKADTKATAPRQGTEGCGGAGGMMGGEMAGMMNGGMMNGAVVNAVYELTGLDKQEVIARRRAGKSFVEIAKAKGVTESQLLEAVKKYHQDFINQRAADGMMTEDMVKYCSQNFEANIKTILNSTTTGPKDGRSGDMMGGMMGGMMSGGSAGMMGGWDRQVPVQTPAVQGQSL